jgi:HAD superfamily hydrolase (TIGR01509 family)
MVANRQHPLERSYSFCPLEGTVVSGKGEGKNFVNLPWARQQFRLKLRMDPFPGTLNVRVEEGRTDEVMEELSSKAIIIDPPDRTACRGFALPAIIEGRYRAFVIVPEVEGYYKDVLELIAEVELRPRLPAGDGERTRFSVGLAPRAINGRIEGVILDMDGTLINTLDPFFHSISAVLGAGNLPRITLPEVCRMLDVGSNLREVLQRAGVNDEEQIARCIEGVKKEFRARKAIEVKLIPKAAEAVALLRQVRGLKIGLATGSTASRSTIEQDLHRFGLLGHFDALTTGTEVEKSKPSPDLIVNSVRKLGLNPSSVLVVGDARMDVIAGKEAGCLTASVLTGVSSNEQLSTARPDMVENDLHELVERLILEGWV